MPAPVTGNNSDCDLVFGADDKLHLYYREFDNSDVVVKHAESTDGITWTTPTTILSGTGAFAMSFSVHMEGDTYVAYYIENSNDRTLKRLENSSAATGWSTAGAVTCTINNIPRGS